MQSPRVRRGSGGERGGDRGCRRESHISDRIGNGECCVRDSDVLPDEGSFTMPASEHHGIAQMRARLR